MKLPGKRTQPLAAHCRNILYEPVMQGATVDAVSLVFPKASDKTNHKILLERIAKQNINWRNGLRRFK